MKSWLPTLNFTSLKKAIEKILFFHKNFTAAYVKFAENESFVNGELRFEQIGATGYINVYGVISGLFNGQFGHGFRVNYFYKNSI